MFCPSCGTLAFPNPKGDIACTNYQCNYNGPANVVIKGADGKDVDLSQAKSSTAAKGRVFQVIKDSDKRHGVLTTDSYMCPNRIDGTPCDCVEVYSELVQTRSSDEPETRMLTCKKCGHGWREY